MSRKTIQPALDFEALTLLHSLGWDCHVGNGRGVWISVARQHLQLVRAGTVLRAYACSTAALGTGSQSGSYRTPLGWHEVGEKIGQGLLRGAMLVGRRWNGDVWTGQKREEDWILSRILRLRGLEPGINQGCDVDTWGRMIYIHGTNHEEKLGHPASHGCIRLANRDVIELFKYVRVGERVLISEG